MWLRSLPFCGCAAAWWTIVILAMGLSQQVLSFAPSALTTARWSRVARTIPRTQQQYHHHQYGGFSSRIGATVPSETEMATKKSLTTTTVLPNGAISTVPTAWDCNDDASICVEVPACNDEYCRTSLDVRIHNVWYDLSGWRKAHPAGAHWIDWYDGRDATEVMDAFHSTKGRAMYQRLPASQAPAVALLEQTVPPDSPTQLAFRQLRSELEDSGWWERDMRHEATLLTIWASLVVGAAVAAHSTVVTVAVAQPIATVLLALSMTAAGWLGHDYIHGVDAFANKLRNFAAVAAGLAPIWWSDKHNKVLYKHAPSRMDCRCFAVCSILTFSRLSLSLASRAHKRTRRG
jgi:Cytochrome b5-like Heme/Steroid binding domain